MSIDPHWGDHNVGLKDPVHHQRLAVIHLTESSREIGYAQSRRVSATALCRQISRMIT
jgi:hypothetical protein